jgi:hypothetical protein
MAFVLVGLSGLLTLPLAASQGCSLGERARLHNGVDRGAFLFQTIPRDTRLVFAARVWHFQGLGRRRVRAVLPGGAERARCAVVFAYFHVLNSPVLAVVVNLHTISPKMSFNVGCSSLLAYVPYAQCCCSASAS